MAEPIRIFLGTEPKTEIFRQVLEFSIRQRTKREVQITPMIGEMWEYPIEGIKVGTGFSLRRWMIPEACDWKGKAIYLDADQLVLADIEELWEQYLSPPSVVACTYQPDKFRTTPWPQTSVMVIDCEKARDHWGFHIDQVLEYLRSKNSKLEYADFMHATWLQPQPAPIPVPWNHLNVLTGETKLLHYTKEPEQPHFNPKHPFADIWRKELCAAIRAKAVNERDYRLGLAQWGVKQDWRQMNGIHPFYKKYLPLFAESPAGA